MGLKDKLELLKLLKSSQGRAQHNMNSGDGSLLECSQSRAGSNPSVPPAQSDISLLSHRRCVHSASGSYDPRSIIKTAKSLKLLPESTSCCSCFMVRARGTGSFLWQGDSFLPERADHQLRLVMEAENLSWANQQSESCRIQALNFILPLSRQKAAPWGQGNRAQEKTRQVGPKSWGVLRWDNC